MADSDEMVKDMTGHTVAELRRDEADLWEIIATLCIKLYKLEAEIAKLKG